MRLLLFLPGLLNRRAACLLVPHVDATSLRARGVRLGLVKPHVIHLTNLIILIQSHRQLQIATTTHSSTQIDSHQSQIVDRITSNTQTVKSSTDTTTITSTVNMSLSFHRTRRRSDPHLHNLTQQIASHRRKQAIPSRAVR